MQKLRDQIYQHGITFTWHGEEHSIPKWSRPSFDQYYKSYYRYGPNNGDWIYVSILESVDVVITSPELPLRKERKWTDYHEEGKRYKLFKYELKEIGTTNEELAKYEQMVHDLGDFTISTIFLKIEEWQKKYNVQTGDDSNKVFEKYNKMATDIRAFLPKLNKARDLMVIPPVYMAEEKENK